MTIDDRTVQEFLETYLVSNTPLFLYKRMRELPSVQRLAHDATPQELLAAYRSHAEAQSRSAADVAIAFACLIALTYHNRREESQRLLRALAPTSLDWAFPIRDIYFQRRPAQTFLDVEAPTPQLLGPLFTASATVSSVATNPPKPTAKGKANI